jgi:hypothetical protein
MPLDFEGSYIENAALVIMHYQVGSGDGCRWCEQTVRQAVAGARPLTAISYGPWRMRPTITPPMAV